MSEPNGLDLIEADLFNPYHGEALLALLDGYAQDPMGGGQGLSDFTRENLLPKLRERQDAVIVLAFKECIPAGLVIAFEGFSTFRCQPLLNLHDVVVAQAFRGQGLSRLLLHKVESIALRRGCCKLTLEVLSGNTIAQAAYRAFGFSSYELDPAAGQALFWEKTID